MLAHLAINEIGAVATLVVQRQTLTAAARRCGCRGVELMRLALWSSMPKLMIRRGVTRMMAESKGRPPPARRGELGLLGGAADLQAAHPPRVPTSDVVDDERDPVACCAMLRYFWLRHAEPAMSMVPSSAL